MYIELDTYVIYMIYAYVIYFGIYIIIISPLFYILHINIIYYSNADLLMLYNLSKS